MVHSREMHVIKEPHAEKWAVVRRSARDGPGDKVKVDPLTNPEAEEQRRKDVMRGQLEKKP